MYTIYVRVELFLSEALDTMALSLLSLTDVGPIFPILLLLGRRTPVLWRECLAWGLEDALLIEIMSALTIAPDTPTHEAAIPTGCLVRHLIEI